MEHRQRVLGIVALAATAGLLAGCGWDDSNAGQAASAAAGGKTLAVVVTTSEVADFARNIGGDSITVTQIIKPNVDPTNTSRPRPTSKPSAWPRW